MIRDVIVSVSQNKNVLMFVSAGIYILGLLSVLNNFTVIYALIFTVLMLLFAAKNIFSNRVIVIWTILFYLGIVNTSVRLRATDDILDLAPVNSTVYGKIISIPQNKDDNKTRFFLRVNKIEYDNTVKTFKNEKVLVSLHADEKLNIYDSYKIRGRLSVPFKSGNPSQFDYGNYLRNYDTYAVFYGHNPYSMRESDIPCYEKIEQEKTLREKYLQNINNYREKILNIHSQYICSPNLEILGGIVFGDDAVSPPEDIKQSFVNSGLLHILAASGMNVAFIYSFFFFFLNLLRVPFRLNIIICMFAVVAYVLMTGLGASVVRAALMLLFVLVGKLIDRDAHNISLLSFVAFLMLLYNPLLINDVGFQLSFVVTFGLLLMLPYILMPRNRILNWLIGTICVPIIAQLWVIPIQIFYFNNVSLYSVFANIMSVPILSVISFGGFVSSLLSLITPISHFICNIFDVVLNPLITIIVNISDFWGKLPNSTIQTSHPNFMQICLYYMILLNIVGFVDKNTREKYFSLLAKTLPALVIFLIISLISLPNHNLEVLAFDVGNADAFLVKTPDNKYIMIDTAKAGYNGGKSQAEMIILKYFADNGIKKVDTLIVTHFDNDHCGGAKDILNKMKVDDLYVNSLNHDSAQAKEIYDAAKENGTKIIKAENNQTVYKDAGLVIENFISDDVAGVGDNETSVITLLKYRDFSMLFTGDAGVATFNNLKQYMPKNITVLKVGHHGASGVVNKSMADYLNPKYAIVSTGENKFGHPSVYTLETLRNSHVLRTDVNNAVKIIVNDKTHTVKTYDPTRKKFR